MAVLPSHTSASGRMRIRIRVQRIELSDGFISRGRALHPRLCADQEGKGDAKYMAAYKQRHVGSPKNQNLLLMTWLRPSSSPQKKRPLEKCYITWSWEYFCSELLNRLFLADIDLPSRQLNNEMHALLVVPRPHTQSQPFHFAFALPSFASAQSISKLSHPPSGSSHILNPCTTNS